MSFFPTSRSTPHVRLFLIALSLFWGVHEGSAQDAEVRGPEPAEYGVGIGISPFAFSVNVSRHFDAQTSLQCVVGGMPESDYPVGLTLDGVDYAVRGELSFVGFFVNHRPFASADWFRVSAGLVVGSTRNTVVNPVTLATYSADYTENPQGYFGVGFGYKVTRGFQLGCDLGWLQSAGPAWSIDAPGADGAADFQAVAGAGFFPTVLPNTSVSIGYGF